MLALLCSGSKRKTITSTFTVQSMGVNFGHCDFSTVCTPAYTFSLRVHEFYWEKHKQFSQDSLHRSWWHALFTFFCALRVAAAVSACKTKTQSGANLLLLSWLVGNTMYCMHKWINFKVLMDSFLVVDVCTNTAHESQEPAVSTCDAADNALNSVVHCLQHLGSENFFIKQDAAVPKPRCKIYTF